MMHIPFIRTVLVALIACGLLSLPGVAQAAMITKDSSQFDLQWNGDVMPTKVGGQGDDPIWTIDDGIITVVPVDAEESTAAFGWLDELDQETGWTGEIQFRITEAPSNARQTSFSFIIAAEGGANQYYHLAATPTQLGGSVDAEQDVLVSGLNFTDAFHTLRIAHPGGSGPATIWLDGQVLVEEYTSPLGHVQNRTQVGTVSDSFQLSGEVEFEYFRMDSTGGYAPVPEPASAMLMGIGALLMFRRKRSAA